ncbi:hypothetical protein ACQRIT_007303 [Beauveria bassiana]
MASDLLQAEPSLRRVTFMWSKAYDTKNWALLASICADEMWICYDKLNMGISSQKMPKEDFIAMLGSSHLLGNPKVSTQHFLGNALFEAVQTKESEIDVVCGEWQIMASHQRVLPDGEMKCWLSQGYLKHFYQRVGAEWKLYGIEPSIVLMNAQGVIEDIFVLQ